MLHLPQKVTLFSTLLSSTLLFYFSVMDSTLLYSTLLFSLLYSAFFKTPVTRKFLNLNFQGDESSKKMHIHVPWVPVPPLLDKPLKHTHRCLFHIGHGGKHISPTKAEVPKTHAKVYRNLREMSVDL